MVNAARVAETLGGWRVMKDRVRTADRLRDRVRTGLPYPAVEAVARRLDVPLGELGAALGIASRTLARRRKTGRLSAEESDRLVRLGRILALAEQVLGDRAKAARWLRQPNRALGRIVPLQHVDTDIGAREVETILLRIAHGVYS
jgi:putative toxin-antitoxin system antitoxin component (TIGR02293 family)